MTDDKQPAVTSSAFHRLPLERRAAPAVQGKRATGLLLRARAPDESLTRGFTIDPETGAPVRAKTEADGRVVFRHVVTALGTPADPVVPGRA
ncbi:hypothetical protein [Streptomyces sp. NPDC092370]|uniref:hypothetical protein n=1 Tax=Streptomyces sp. NPDC092370 TaxID=3366016 RepID=UPI00381354DB